MAVCIVHILEVIDVENDKGKFFSVSFRFLVYGFRLRSIVSGGLIKSAYTSCSKKVSRQGDSRGRVIALKCPKAYPEDRWSAISFSPSSNLKEKRGRPIPLKDV